MIAGLRNTVRLPRCLARHRKAGPMKMNQAGRWRLRPEIARSLPLPPHPEGTADAIVHFDTQASRSQDEPSTALLPSLDATAQSSSSCWDRAHALGPGLSSPEFFGPAPRDSALLSQPGRTEKKRANVVRLHVGPRNTECKGRFKLNPTTQMGQEKNRRPEATRTKERPSRKPRQPSSHDTSMLSIVFFVMDWGGTGVYPHEKEVDW